MAPLGLDFGPELQWLADDILQVPEAHGEAGLDSPLAAEPAPYFPLTTDPAPAPAALPPPLRTPSPHPALWSPPGPRLTPHHEIPGCYVAHANAPEWVHHTSSKVVVQDDHDHLRLLCTVLCCPTCGLLVSAEHMAEHYRKAHKWPGLRCNKVKVLCEWAGCTKAINYGNLKKHLEDIHLCVRSVHCPHCHLTWRSDDRRKVHPRLADECEVRERALRGNAPTKAYSMEPCAWCNTWLDGPSTFPHFDKDSDYATIIGPVE